MTTKKLCLTAMGTALFVVLSLCLQVPVFENYYLCLGYVALMVFCYYFGAFSSVVVGTLGVVLYCLLINGLRGMPGWATGNIVISLALSIICNHTTGMKNRWLRRMILIAAIISSTAIGILGLKSFVEMVLYAQPFFIRVVKNIYAFIADVVVLTLSIPICEGLATIIHPINNELTRNGFCFHKDK